MWVFFEREWELLCFIDFFSGSTLIFKEYADTMGRAKEWWLIPFCIAWLRGRIYIIMRSRWGLNLCIDSLETFISDCNLWYWKSSEWPTVDVVPDLGNCVYCSSSPSYTSLHFSYWTSDRLICDEAAGNMNVIGYVFGMLAI